MDDTVAENEAFQLRRRLANIAGELVGLVKSSEPAVVFTSLARLCVPTFSDICTVDITDGERTAYRVGYPLPIDTGDSGAPAEQWTIRTVFESGEPRPSRHYTGVITHTWLESEPTSADVIIAKALARHAVTIVHRERVHPDTCCDDETVDLVSRRRADQRRHRREQTRRSRTRALPL